MKNVKKIWDFISLTIKVMWHFIAPLSLGVFFLMGFEYCTLRIFNRTDLLYLGVIYGCCIMMHFMNKKKNQGEEILDEIEKWDEKYNNNPCDLKTTDIWQRSSELQKIIRSRLDYTYENKSLFR